MSFGKGRESPAEAPWTRIKVVDPEKKVNMPPVVLSRPGGGLVEGVIEKQNESLKIRVRWKGAEGGEGEAAK